MGRLGGLFSLPVRGRGRDRCMQGGWGTLLFAGDAGERERERPVQQGGCGSLPVRGRESERPVQGALFWAREGERKRVKFF